MKDLTAASLRLKTLSILVSAIVRNCMKKSSMMQTMPTYHPKIKVAALREYPYDLVLKNEKEFYRLSFEAYDMTILKKMKEIVPEYKSRHSKYEILDR